VGEDNRGAAREKDELIGVDVPDKLHIGGTERRAGWQVLNVQPGEHVDHVADLRNLDQFADNSFDLVYGSHVLEHFGYIDDLPLVINSLHRIIRPGGRLLASVPDLEILSRMIADDSLTIDERFHLMRMLFGGQTDPYDFHYVGLDMGIMTHYLSSAGFREVYRVPYFNIFADSSNTLYKDTLISLNVVAFK